MGTVKPVSDQVQPKFTASLVFLNSFEGCNLSNLSRAVEHTGYPEQFPLPKVFCAIDFIFDLSKCIYKQSINVGAVPGVFKLQYNYALFKIDKKIASDFKVRCPV